MSSPCSRFGVLVVISVVAFALLAAPSASSQVVSFTPVQTSQISLIHADFNSDGREDFILFGGTSGCSNSSFGLVLSTGAQSYAPPVCYALPAGVANYFAIGDFNGDGFADVIVSNAGTKLYEYLGSRSGKLHLQATLTAPTTVVGLAAADVNHDGKIDLVFGGGVNAGQKLYTWFGNGHGGFTAGPNVPMPVQGDMSIGDFDGDGNVDVFSQNISYSTVAQVFYGDGTGHFTAGAPFSEQSFFAPYDVNSDGKMDLVTAPFAFSVNGNTYYNYLKVYYGNANRTFTPRQIQLASCTDWSRPPAVADFNGDGVNDIAVVEAADCQGNGPDTVDVLLGNPDGSYQPEQVVYSGTSSQLLTELEVLRADPDSKPDFALSDVSTGNQPWFVFFNTTIGNFPGCNAPDGYEGIALCSPTSTVAPGSPVQFSIGASNQTAGRKVEVWIDGKKRSEQLKHAFSHYSFLDASYALSPGKHNVAVFSSGWDNLLQKIQFPLTVGSSTCAPPASPGVNVCSPINNSTVSNTVLAWAGGTVSGKIARMEVWVDGVKKFTSTGSPTLKTNITLASGKHKFVFNAINLAGQKWTQTVYATVP